MKTLKKIAKITLLTILLSSTIGARNDCKPTCYEEGVVEGYVYLHGKHIADAEVTLYKRNYNYFDQTFTNRRGFFEFLDVPRGWYEIKAYQKIQDRGYSDQDRFYLSRGEIEEIELNLHKEYRRNN